MKISPSDFESIIINKIETYDNSAAMDEIGRVSYVADGIAFIYGLLNVGILEILEFEGGQRELH